MGWEVGVFEISRITLTRCGEKKQHKITPQRGMDPGPVWERGGVMKVGAFKEVKFFT